MGKSAQCSATFWQVDTRRRTDERAYEERNPIEDFDVLTEAQRRKLFEDLSRIDEKWDAELFNRLTQIQSERRNQSRQQRKLVVLLSVLSPYNAVTFVSMDLARTSFVQLEKVEDAVREYMPYQVAYTRDKGVDLYARDSREELTDFSPFTYKDTETIGPCLVRNLFPILNLTMLAILGFACTYVLMLRYDVR